MNIGKSDTIMFEESKNEVLNQNTTGCCPQLSVLYYSLHKIYSLFFKEQKLNVHHVVSLNVCYIYDEIN